MWFELHLPVTTPEILRAERRYGKDWIDEAECQKHDPDIWDNTKREREAKRICKKCPVIATCQKFAIEAEIEGGIWGGLNSEERDALSILNGG